MFSSTLPFSICRLQLRGDRSILGPAMRGLLSEAGHYSHLHTIEIRAFDYYTEHRPRTNHWCPALERVGAELSDHDLSASDQDTSDEYGSDWDASVEVGGASVDRSELQAIAASFKELGVNFVLEFSMGFRGFL